MTKTVNEVIADDKESRPAEPNRIPTVKSSVKGRISRTMEMLAELYKQDNPDRDCRYVYSPEHRSDLSNVLSRMSQGYQYVFVKDLAHEVPGFEEGDSKVRVGDVVLMSIPTEVREAIQEEILEDAAHQVDAVEDGYKAAIEAATDGGRGEHRSVPRGRSIIEERDHHYDVEQRTS